MRRIFFPFQPWLTAAKRLLSLNCSIKLTFFVKMLKKLCPKCNIHWKIPWNLPLRNCQSRFQRKKYPSQPWLMVAKDIFSFATVTDGCEEANFMGFCHFIYENELTSENMYLPMNLAKRATFISLLQSKFPESKI